MRYKIGETICAQGDIEINAGLEKRTLEVVNGGDRPIQIGSHYHFFEVNKYLTFPRERAYGFRLDIPSGTAVRFEPGEEKEVVLTAYGGKRIVCGFNGLTMGAIDDPQVKAQALQKA
ncbi:MAG: urease subunit beta, partial [Peptococcaceae bacterium]|nr:urease subunit beta [Peptococcaceae bacterium]